MNLSSLNERQREAVLALDGAVLVIAGAGSGKTRVLTTRAAYLIEKGVRPYNILAITFTNKAANEMKNRIAGLAAGSEEIWACTFHSLCARILRIDGDKLGYTSSFSIYDSADSLSVIKNILNELDVASDIVAPRAARSLISRAKNKYIKPDSFAKVYGNGDVFKYTAQVYARYEQQLRSNNAMDFDDLLLNTLDLFNRFPEILDKYHKRFLYIMVDEYQDTNSVQYRIVKLLAKGSGNIFVVGDDDQSIYGWRGADITNILDFEKDFPSARVIRLEQNYRSHQHILDAADGIICNNVGRMGKKLWSSVKAGQKPLEFEAESDLEEAQFIAEKAASLIREGKFKADDIAVLYRVNSQSRVIENKLKERNLPYKIYSGQSFYERKEIKDLIAYLNLLCNPFDNVCFLRSVCVPRRGIGNVSLGKLTSKAEKAGISLLQACQDYSEIFSKNAKESLGRFTKMLAGIRDKMHTQTVLETIEQVFEASGLKKYMLSDTTAEGKIRLLNIEEFFKSAADFIKTTPAPHTLEAFLERNALISDADSVGSEEGNITLTTLHSAKGLEFSVVFIAGLEEGLLPHNLSLMDDNVEEERRLCYVGVTRAKKRLYLTWSRTRYVRTSGGFERMPSKRSRFLSEVPGQHIEPAGVKRGTSAYIPQHFVSLSAHSLSQGIDYKPSFAVNKKAYHEPAAFTAGKSVTHPKFGQGKIIRTNGEGNERIAVVRFESAGEKKMFVAFAPLKIV